ncbi:hypothetical protein BT63DRAFT_430142 [Microthyrium microscopicum]|uniref:DUF4396 domain-containing protein n=1 Tax=Microthyrium microscopicum TaxID=703497 RepID=A0A6A6TY27_9PEZI|nr:hypothetical protein BT63DRAFT_430142 [Microthyrium microscopicum]
MDDSMGMDYHPPEALTIIAGIFLVFGGLCGLIVLGDIIWRRGWKSMMLIMIPTYPITATYMGPVGLYLYFKYGRAADPKSLNASGMGHQHHAGMAMKDEEAGSNTENDMEHHHGHDHAAMEHSTMDHSTMDHSAVDHSAPEMTTHDIHMHHMPGDKDRPLWATILIGVSHCGAGCVLGDIVGEWLVYGTEATIRDHDIWPCLLVSYAFALLFGIVFQYLSIAPMSGQWGPKTVWRAAKADVLSLTFFEIGAFGWMIVYQVGIWNYRLEMTTWTYWWQMQVAMFLGFWTAAPINWWLITRGVKEPCA